MSLSVENPRCEHMRDLADCDHPEWKHAETFKEIADAIKEYGETYDRDSDRIIEVKIGYNALGEKDQSYATVTYSRSGGTGNYDVTDNGLGSPPGYVLVPISAVTEDEVQAAIASIMGVS